VILIKEDIKKMADLLRSGHTMLNLACPICNNPIFKNKIGELFCPICNREVIVVENKDQQTKDKPIGQEINNQVIKIPNKDWEVLTTTVHEVIYEKIDLIIQKLKDETQIDLIEKYLNLLVKCYDILDKKSK